MERVTPNCRFECSGKSLEHGFGQMMVVFASCFDVHIAFHRLAKTFEEMPEHLGRSVSDHFPGKRNIPTEIYPSAQVHQYHGIAIIHWQHKSVPFNATLVTKCLGNGFSECDSHIFHCMMLMHFEIS